MLILAGVSLNAIVGDNGIIPMAQKVSIMSKFATYKEELAISAVDDSEICASRNKLKNYISSMEDQDIDKFVILNSKLLYIDENELELNAAKSVGLNSLDSGGSIKEIKSIIGGVIDLKKSYPDKIANDDSQLLTEIEHKDTSEGLIGIRLFSRNGLNLVNKTWNIIIEYNKDNNEVERYGSGYYWLKKEETYIIDGESIKLENDYVVNYNKKEFTALSGRAVNWNETSTLAVTDGLVLNVDPMSLADGEWRQNTTDTNFYDFYVKNVITNQWIYANVQKTGDVSYNEINKSLSFNENKTDNPDGIGGYLKTECEGIDFTEGFSLELYFKLNDYGNYIDDCSGVGFFCRTKSLDYFDFTSSLRCTIDNKMQTLLLKLRGSSSWIGSGDSISYTTADGGMYFRERGKIDVGNDVYVTMVYTPFNKNKSADYQEKYYDDFMEENEVDRVLYFQNGELLSKTYYGHDSFLEGLKTWNNDDCPFFIGVANMWSQGMKFYLRGQIYTTRLYLGPLSAEDVKANYDVTLKYRSSF